MTVRQTLEATLIEINKVKAPSLLTEDFIYFLNKAIISYINKKYAVYEETQQLTDDLRVLTGNTVINTLSLIDASIFAASYTGLLPQDYFHMLNCSAEFEFSSTYRTKCKLKRSDSFKGVKRMTSSMYSGIIDNYYLKPSQKNPYFYLRNRIEPILDAGIRIQGSRDGNTSPVNIEVIYGDDNIKYNLKTVRVDYLKIPLYMSITEDEIMADEDTSQVMEFPYYVCLDIIKELVALLLENASDPRLQSNIPINQGAQQQVNAPVGRGR